LRKRLRGFPYHDCNDQMKGQSMTDRAIALFHRFRFGVLALLVSAAVASPAIAQEGEAEAPKPQTLLLVEAAPLDGMFVAEKDAGLRRTLGALPARLRAWREAVPEMRREVPAEAIDLLENLMTRTKRFAVTNRGFDPETGMPGIGVAMTLDLPEGADAGRAIDAQVEAVRALAAANFKPAPSQRFKGLKDVALPFGVLTYGAREREGKWSYDILFGQADDAIAAMKAGPQAPAGLQTVMRGQIDLAAWTPFTQMMLGFAAMQMPPGTPNLAEQARKAGAVGPDAISYEIVKGYTADAGIAREVTRRLKRYREAWGKSDKTISIEDLRVVPGDAHVAWVGAVEPQASWERMRTQFATQEGGAEVDRVLGEIREKLGLDLKTDVIDTLGEKAAVFLSDTTGGNAWVSACAVVALKDTARLEKSLRSAGDALARQVDAEAPVAGMLGLATFEVDGARFYQLRTGGLPSPLEPTIAVVGDRLFVALSPEAARSAAAHAKGAGASGGLAADRRVAPAFAGGHELTTFLIIDSARTARDGYPGLTMLGSMLSGAMRVHATRDASFDAVMPSFGAFNRDVQPIMRRGYWDGEDWVVETRADRSILVNAAGLIGVGDTAPIIFGAIVGGAASQAIREQMEQQGVYESGEAWEVEEEPADEPAEAPEPARRPRPY